MSELEPQQTQPETTQPAAAAPQAEAPAETQQAPPAPVEAPTETAVEPPAAAPKPEDKPAPKQNDRPQQERRERPAGGGRPERQPRGERPPQGDKPAGDRPPRADRPERGPDRGGDRRGGPPREHGKGPDRGGRPMEPPSDIDLDKLVADSLYLDNAAHAIVARMRDMDSGTRSQLRRLFSAVRRACRAAESDRQHHFVMLRARLAYTIARHQLRSLDPLERLLLQVTRKNDARGYERFRDLFEAIVAYNE
ncbi:type III-A CRISPR-associated protein Csm2 [uncultured Paludibaculum sp.]|uniref:type III-A CRISPR-associated protein Csm2 n=1 Tax=uncultured Paludibaculum sp. TaxID=1765020 RepID=UPI002AAA6DBD|nr:type III-A CRISPR-associated protein Csm2 [uncultured Paludibaculum sp.]